MVAVPEREAQNYLDTRALEIASAARAEARAMYEGHQRECDRERLHVAERLTGIEKSLTTISSRMWAVAGAAILTLVAALGSAILIIKDYMS